MKDQLQKNYVQNLSTIILESSFVWKITFEIPANGKVYSFEKFKCPSYKFFKFGNNTDLISLDAFIYWGASL